jgi:hypothetical protein
VTKCWLNDPWQRGAYTVYQPGQQEWYPDISNNVGPGKLFLKTLLSFHLKEFFSFVFFLLCIDDHGPFVI